MVLFGFFSLVLVAVYWINRAVVLFDQIIGNGHSAMVFLEFSALSLPNVIQMVIPMAAIISVIYGTNRLASESELVVVQATGFSPYRLSRAIWVFGCIAAVFVAILAHTLTPVATRMLAERQLELSRNMTARVLQEGVFLHPSEGMTFYIGNITPAGELRDVFLSDARADDHRVNYSAGRAMLVRQNETLMLIMFDGMAQDLSLKQNTMVTTSFSDINFDIGSLMDASTVVRITDNMRPTAQLLFSDPEAIKTLGGKVARWRQIGHERIAQSTLTISAVVVGFSMLLVGGFSRFGLWRQILAAIGLLVMLKMIDNYANGVARQGAHLWPLVYASTVAGFGLSWALLWVSTKPGLFIRKSRLASA